MKLLNAQLLALVYLVTVFGCSGSPVANEGDPAGYDPFATPAVPATPPVFIDAGISIYDPSGALEGRSLSVERLPADPSLTGALATIRLEPSAALSAPVHIVVPLNAPLPAGTEVMLLTLDEASSFSASTLDWYFQSVGVVLDDGMSALVTARHFSVHGLIAWKDRDQARRDFASGSTDCTGRALSIETFSDGQSFCASGESGEAACVGAIDGPLSSQDAQARLVSLVMDDLVFKNEECRPATTGCWKDFRAGTECAQEGEDELGAPELRAPLARLAEAVDRASCGTLAVRITDSFDSGCPTRPMGEHSASSVHYEGRAVDLTLALRLCSTWDVARKRCLDPTTPTNIRFAQSAALGRLAGLASKAGFGWVQLEGNHVHASIGEASSPPMAEPSMMVIEADVEGGMQTISTGSLRPTVLSDGRLRLSSRPVVGEGWWDIVFTIPNQDASGRFTVGSEATFSLEADGVAFSSNPEGYIEVRQVPTPQKNAITTFDGNFDITLTSEDGARATLRGAWSFPDVGFW